jgi:3-phosphoshikimate 1-carboxyvinyltransferase
LPGDKSISHRYAMLAALADGETKLENYATGADCGSTLACLRALGCSIQEQGASLTIAGRSLQLNVPANALDCGNSGSTMRMLAGILAAQNFASELTGDSSLLRRPMQRITGPLAQMGAAITTTDSGRPPLRIRGGSLRGITYRMPVASAQVKTSVMFAGLAASGETVVQEPIRTRDHGELALRTFGAEVEQTAHGTSIRGGQRLHAVSAAIPGDISTAAFFVCAAALFPASNLILDGLLLNPTRAAILDFVAGMGARISMLDVEEVHGELVGTVRVQGTSHLKGGKIAGRLSAALIDELPVLAAIAPYTENGIEILDAGELRVKESDRISAVAENLTAMGATVEVTADGLRVPGRQQLHGADLQSRGDHRIAMAFAIAALRASDEVCIRGAEAARISYPDFFSALQALADS